MFIVALLSLTISCKGDKAKQAGEAADVGAASENAVAYNVDTTATVINWSGSKQTGTHHGIIKLTTGTVYVNEGKVEGGNFTINMNSIATTDVKPEDGKAELEAHLKGTNMDEKADHFFNVKKFPEGKFEITKISDEAGKTMIEGNLTLKATTKNVKFPATITVNDSVATIKSDKFVIDRTQWKINYGSKSVFSDLGDKFINDEIELTVNVKAAK